MSWRDNLLAASFRGVPFSVTGVSTSVGRRTVLHEYPFRDIPFTEDMGLAADRFSISGFVIQSTENAFDYFAERDALIAALKTSGPATLVHPTLGIKLVALSGQARIEERFVNGAGMAAFAMTFVLAGEDVVPAAEDSIPETVGAAADDAFVIMGEEFEDTFDTGGPDFLTGVGGALDDAQAALDMVSSTLRTVQATVVSEISSVTTAIASIRGTLASIMAFPDQLVSAIENTLSVYEDLIPFIGSDGGVSLIRSALGVTAYGKSTSDTSPSLYGGALNEIPLTTPVREQQLRNRQVMVDYMRVGGMAQAIRVASNATFESEAQAQEMLELLSGTLVELMQYIADNSADDVMYDTLRGLLPVLVEAMTSKGASLPTVVSRVLAPDGEPPLLLAHQLYNDISREQEIINRNRSVFRNPALPEGGATIEVLDA